jgi:hypothetical protein
MDGVLGAGADAVDTLDSPRPHACDGKASKAISAAAQTRAALDVLSAAIRNSWNIRPQTLTVH